MRTRRERVQRAIQENPDLSNHKLAKLVGVSRQAVVVNKRKMAGGNALPPADEPEGGDTSPPVPTVKLPRLSKFLEPNICYRTDSPLVRSIERVLNKALKTATIGELAYLVTETLKYHREVLTGEIERRHEHQTAETTQTIEADSFPDRSADHSACNATRH
jgi:hypothetical protein